MSKLLAKVNVKKNKKVTGKYNLSIKCICGEYLSSRTAQTIEAISKEIFEDLPEELMLFHQLSKKPVLHIREEQDGIYIESPYIKFIKDIPEYKSRFSTITFCIKRDYVVSTLKKERVSLNG